jgi:protocatechuate 3,4-dioxygenase beta subunit
MIRRLACAIVAACASSAAAAQNPAPAQSSATALIVGRAVDGTTGKAIGGVAMTLTPASMPEQGAPPGMEPPVSGVAGPTRVMTSAEGFFVFYGLPAGLYRITASKTGYLPGSFGRRAPSGTGLPLVVADAERKTDVTVSLWKHATIGGTIVDENGDPLIGVQVRMLRRTITAGRYKFTQTGNMPATDDRGVYRASWLEPGEYIAGVVASRATVPVAVQDAYAKALTSGAAAMAPFEPVSGLITPVGGVRMGTLVLQSGRQAPGGGASDVPAIRSVSTDGRVFVYPTVYYPNAVTPVQSTAITVGSGEERSNINFQLRPVPSVRVSGTVLSPAGPVGMIGLQLLRIGSDELQRDGSFEEGVTIADASGAFTFLGVTSGQYAVKALKVPPRPASTGSYTSVVQVGASTVYSGGGAPGARPPVPSDPTLWAVTPLTVTDADITGVTVSLQAGARVNGRVEFDGIAAKPTADRIQAISILLEPSDGRSPGSLSDYVTLRMSRVDAEGRLQTYSQPAGSYIVRATSAPPGWTFASAMLNGRDVSSSPFELGADDVPNLVIRYTDHPSELSGTVRDDAGKPDLSAVVLAFPTDERAWSGYGLTARRLPILRVNENGGFRLVGLPDGDYYVAAIREEAAIEWRAPAFLKKLMAQALRTTIVEGKNGWLDLKTSTIR